MLVDATHPEETRVVVVNGNRVEEFDFETSTKKQLKGNIYLARVTRVEPSLQAAFVEYGGNRHGFLAFSEIHPDYYRIPVADRQALIAAEAAEDDDDMPERSAPPGEAPHAGQPATPGFLSPPPPATASPGPSFADALESRSGETPSGEPRSDEPASMPAAADNVAVVSSPAEAWKETPSSPQSDAPTAVPAPDMPPAPPRFDERMAAETALDASQPSPDFTGQPLIESAPSSNGGAVETVSSEPVVLESIGGDETEEVEQRRRHRPMRHYKIQEVIKRRQILLVQVVKEERGTKGAALTTYLSLPGRYCVLMPNTARGGGISRRITNAQDRRRLKSIMEELQVPDGMAVILRTAGMERQTSEIKRDYEYLMRLWDDIRELTLHSVAPCLIYEEGNLVKRAIRDLYSSDLEEILVEGETGYESARSFMNMLMPDHIDRVRRYDDPSVPLFQRFQVENELDNIHSPTVRLRSGGYIVINQTEALVAIDVNSGRATRERHIEETAFKTNMESAEEIARQLRLRDLAGLIVIDFIDMEEHRNQHAVERRMKESMRSDRARIQIGRISPFGLLELSRQRLRPSLSEVSSDVCQHCAGTGRVRSTESTVLHVLRGVEEEGMRLRTAEATLVVPTPVALYMLNHKREALQRIEARYGLHVVVQADDALIPPAYRLDRTKQKDGAAALPSVRPMAPAPVRADTGHGEDTYAHTHSSEESEGLPHETRTAPASEARQDGGEDGHGRRRRRRRRGRGERHGQPGEQPTGGHERYEAGRGQEPRAPHDRGDVAGSSNMPEAEGGPIPLIPEPGQAPNAGQGSPQGFGAGAAPGQEGSEEHRRRRRRRGRRGGRHRQGEAGQFEAGAPGAPAAPAEPSRPVIIGPGHDLPPDSPFAAPPVHEPPRVEGPGDAHDWPWNRRAERFPDSPAPQRQEPAHRAPEPVNARPEPFSSPQPTFPRTAEPAADPAPQAEEPKGPPRKGWWKRLTS
jgi:ribonuclease E